MNRYDWCYFGLGLAIIIFGGLGLYAAYAAQPTDERRAAYIKDHKCEHMGYVGKQSVIYKTYKCDNGLKLETDF